MARLPRLALAGQLHLVIQRGHNGQPVFRDAVDFAAYLDHLRAATRLHETALHGYALLDAEVLLLATPAEAPALSALMQAVSRRFVPGYNRRHGRSGALWEGRFASTVVDAAAYGLACLRLIEQAPVQARTVVAATDYCWSSAAHHCGRAASPWVADHRMLWTLGNTPFEREACWQLQLAQPLAVQEGNLLRAACLRGWALSERNAGEVTSWQTERRLFPLARGRPSKSVSTSRAAKAIDPPPIK